MALRGQERDVRTRSLFVGNNALQLHQVGIDDGRRAGGRPARRHGGQAGPLGTLAMA